MKAKLNNVTLNFDKQGDGEPLILLHGNGEDHHIFDKLVDKLKNHFTIYAIDTRNHGLSTKTDNYTYKSMAEDIKQFINQLDLIKPSVLGFSDGAILSLILAIEDSNLFNKMILLGVNLKPDDFKKEIYNYLQAEYQKDKNPLLKLMLEQPNIELATLNNVFNKALVIFAENDLFRDDLHTDIVDAMPNATLKIMLKHTHDSYIVDQDILYNDIIDFL